MRLLKLTGRALGAVRDLDVLIEKAEAFQLASRLTRPRPLAPLLAAWRRQRDAAREELLDYLDSRNKPNSRESFEEFLAPRGPAPSASPGLPTPYRVRHLVAGLLINLTRCAGLPDVHACRPPAPRTTRSVSSASGCRYAMEFFREFLGDPARRPYQAGDRHARLAGRPARCRGCRSMVATFLRDRAASAPPQPRCHWPV